MFVLSHSVGTNLISTGNNKINSLDNIRELRSCNRRLRLLNLKGNPASRDDDYKTTVLAFLPSLKYLDYQLIDTVDAQVCNFGTLTNKPQVQQKMRIVSSSAADTFFKYY
jgi:hypothetical protein